MDLAQLYGEESLRLAEAHQDPELQMAANRALHSIALALGQHATSVAYAEEVIAFYRTHRPTLTYDDAWELALELASSALSLAPIGYPDQALRRAQEALALVKSHNHQFGIAGCLGIVANMYFVRGDWQAGLEFAEGQVRVSTNYNFSLHRTFGELHKCEALAMLGDVDVALELMRKTIAERVALGVNHAHAYYLHSLADACGRVGRVAEGLSLVNEALSEAENSRNHQYGPKAHQIKGDLLLRQNLSGDQWANAQQEAEACFRRAIEIAQSQGTKLWEARALASLCRLLHSQGRDEVCRQQLADLYAWFTEGFETEDLRVVQAVLQETA